MDGVFAPSESRTVNLAGLIRATSGGLESGWPPGICYPGVPSVEELLDQMGLDGGDERMTEEEWLAAVSLVDPDDYWFGE